MPGSWNAADDSGAKKTEGSHGKAKSATVEDSHSRNNESGENGNQNGTGWDNSNDWNNGNNDTKDEPAPQGNGWNSGWENQNNESKELPEKEGSGWSKGSKGSKAKSVQGNDAWVSSDWANGDNTSKDQADGVKDSSENDNNKPDDSWKNVGFGGVATDTGVNDWNNGDANAQNDAPGPTAWENPEPEKNDSNDRNDNNGGGFDTGWPADDNDQNKPDDTPAEGLWENGGGGGGGDDWNKGDTGGGDWNTGDNKDESKEQDGTGGDSWNVQPAFDSANDNGEQNQPSDDQNWGDNKGWGEAQSQKDNEGSKKDDAPGNGWENNNNEVKPQNDAPGWDNNPPATAPNDHKSTRSSKTRHSSSHRPRAPSTTPKEHWSFPPPAPKKLFTIAEEIESVSSTKHKSPKIPTVPPEPILTIPETKAKSEGLSHQVRAGPGTMYTHAVGRPEYIDTLERPYAVFRFKYRTRDYLRKLLGSEVPKSESAELDPVKEVEKLKVLSDEQKIEEILRLKKLVEAGGEKREEKRGNDDVDTLVKAWVGDQQERSRNNSRKSSKKGGSEGKKSAEGAKAASNQSGSKKWGDGEGGGAKPAWGEADEKSGSKQGEGDDNWGGGDGDNWGGGGAPGIW